MDFTTVKEISKKMGEHNDCAVKAAAIATGVDYAKTHTAFATNGRRARSGTRRNTTEAAIKQLGFKLEDVTRQVRARGGKTVRSAERVLGKGSYLVGVSGHLLCIKDGKVEDWTEGRQHRVQLVWRVTPANAPEQVEAPAQPSTQPRKLQVKVGPAQPKKGTVKETIHNVANEFWIQAGRPTDVAVLRKLRARMMDFLELTHGVKRTSASTELGQWQKSIL